MKRLFAGAACAAVLGLGVPTASAQAGMEAATPMDVGASSTLKGKKDKYAPWRVFDADWSGGDGGEGPTYLTTGWCEGKKDQGIGEFLEISGIDVSFTTLQIAAGFWKSDKLWKANNRPTKLTVTATSQEGQVQTFEVAVPATMELAILEAPQPVDAVNIKIAFAEVTKGKVNDTCLSAVTIVNGEQTRIPFLAEGPSVQDLFGALTSLGEGFSKCDTTVLAERIKFPLSYKSLPDPSGETKPIKKKWKKMKDLLKSCKKGEVPMLFDEIDFMWVITEGPGKVGFRVAGNEMGAAIWHLTYEYNDDASNAAWKLTGADYR